MIITKGWLERIATPPAGYKKVQLKALGVYPAKAGWRGRLIGRELDPRLAEFCERMKGKNMRKAGKKEIDRLLSEINGNQNC